MNITFGIYAIDKIESQARQAAIDASHGETVSNPYTSAIGADKVWQDAFDRHSQTLAAMEAA